MNVVADLMAQPGVTAAGQFAFRGDRFYYRGELTPEQGRLLAIICRTTLLTLRMQSRIAHNGPHTATSASELLPLRGWSLSGPRQTLCFVADLFCVVESGEATAVALEFMHNATRRDPMSLV